MDAALHESLTRINDRLDIIESRMAQMRNDNARIERQGQTNANDTKLLLGHIPPSWVTPLVTSLAVAAILLPIILATSL